MLSRLFKQATMGNDVRWYQRYAASINVWTSLAVGSSLRLLNTAKWSSITAGNSMPPKRPGICTELTEAQIQHATIPITAAQPKVTDIQDLLTFAKRLFEQGEPGLCDLKDNKPYEPYKPGYPSVPPSMMFWYRGHHYPSRDLMSSVHRFKEEPRNSWFYESALVKKFRSKNSEYKHDTMSESLAIMQHYGQPTRLLDWSAHISKAAYFACQSDKLHDNEDGIIWVLNPFRLNLAATLSQNIIGLALTDSFDAEIRSLQAITDNYAELREHADLILRSAQRPEMFTFDDYYRFLWQSMEDQELRKKMNYSIAVDLGFPNPRIAAQQGMFTIAGGKQYFNRQEMQKNIGNKIFDAPVSLFTQVQEIQKKRFEKDPFLKCIRIENSCKSKIREQLDNILGINDSSMMLDLDSYGKTARALYQFNRR